MHAPLHRHELNSKVSHAQLRVATRLGVQLVSTDFNSRDYYTNIRKAICAGFFMQVHHAQSQPCVHVQGQVNASRDFLI